MKNNRTVNVTQTQEFEEIIDVRTPAEFAEDHIPGAVNFPVLSNEERIVIGTLYKQESPFAAKKLGAALIARNIANHLETEFQGRPVNWKPLVYCWRGGNRSGAMTHILNQVGWRAKVLEGGYKAYRRHVVGALGPLCDTFNYLVVSGSTGTGKSLLLQVLKNQGLQILDLEGLANHKGSVLGGLPHIDQPSQKMFETLLLQQLMQMNPQKPIFIEAESRKIGQLQVPDELLKKIRTSECIEIEAPIDVRVHYLMGDYDYFLKDAATLKNKIEFLKGIQSREIISYWNDLIDQSNWQVLIPDILEKHYDPLYQRAHQRSSNSTRRYTKYQSEEISENAFKALVVGFIQNIQ